MGKVIRNIKFKSLKDAQSFLKKEFNFELSSKERCDKVEDKRIVYKNKELDSILVNLEIEEGKEDTLLSINKLVSLKAFLLSKEQGMDINSLISNINRVMKMSSQSISTAEGRIIVDDNIKVFLSKAKIETLGNDNGKIILDDGKRKVSIGYLEDKTGRVSYNFNEIMEIQ